MRAIAYESPEEVERRLQRLQSELDEVLARLPVESRLGVSSLRPIRGTEVGDPLLAIDVEASFDAGAPRRFALRSHAWIDGYFDGRGRTDTCRSLLIPPDILAITQPTVFLERISADIIVRGVLCYVRSTTTAGRRP